MFLDELDAREYHARRELRRMEIEELEETVARRRAERSERQREQHASSATCSVELMREGPEQHNAGRPPGPKPRGGRIAELLRDMLGRAERGELRCIAVATVNTDDSIGTAWADNGDPRVFTLVGALEEIQRRLLAPPEPDDD